MKYIIIILFGITLLNCSSKKQILTDQNSENQRSIEIKPFQEKSTKSISESKALFLVDGKVFAQEEIEKIEPNDIDTITVIKDKKEIEKYTTDNYDGVVIIEMKKK